MASSICQALGGGGRGGSGGGSRGGGGKSRGGGGGWSGGAGGGAGGGTVHSNTHSVRATSVMPLRAWSSSVFDPGVQSAGRVSPHVSTFGRARQSGFAPTGSRKSLFFSPVPRSTLSSKAGGGGGGGGGSNGNRLSAAAASVPEDFALGLVPDISNFHSRRLTAIISKRNLIIDADVAADADDDADDAADDNDADDDADKDDDDDDGPIAIVNTASRVPGGGGSGRGLIENKHSTDVEFRRTESV